MGPIIKYLCFVHLKNKTYQKIFAKIENIVQTKYCIKSNHELGIFNLHFNSHWPIPKSLQNWPKLPGHSFFTLFSCLLILFSLFHNWKKVLKQSFNLKVPKNMKTEISYYVHSALIMGPTTSKVYILMSSAWHSRNHNLL